MIKKVVIVILSLFVLMNCAYAMDSSNWSEATVGYEEFKIPPQYENPYKSDFDMYEFDEDLDVFTIRFVNPNIMELYGYFLQRGHSKKVNVSGHDAVHFTSYDRYDEANNSKLWFSAGEEFYYIAWRGENITPEIREVVKSVSPSKYSHDEFYSILNDEFKNYQLVKAVESQRYDYPRSDDGIHPYVGVGSNGINFGVIM